MSKISVFISSCARDRDVECGVLNTWIEWWGDQVEHYMILGDGNTFVNDCDWIVQGLDDYNNCAIKTWHAANFAAKTDMPYIFKCDIDTYVAIPRLLNFDIDGKDYIGYRCSEGHAAGGNGYLLSLRACKILAEAKPTTGYQDLWVGQTLAQHGIECAHYSGFAGQGPWNNSMTSVHLGVSGQRFNPQWMYRCHQDYLDSGYVPG